MNHAETFFSYSRANSDFALRLGKDLKAAGGSIWIDQLDIPTGARWDEAVETALNECSIFLVILSPESINSENVKDEIGYAIDAGKQILPILIKACAIPLRLRRFQYIDFSNKPYIESLEETKRLLGISYKENIEKPGKAEIPASAPQPDVIVKQVSTPAQPTRQSENCPNTGPGALREKVISTKKILYRGIIKQDDKSNSEEQTSNDKKKISVAKIGLISAIAVAVIGLVSSVINTYLPLLAPIQATQTVEVGIIPQIASYSLTSLPISPETTSSALPTNISSSCIPILISPTEGAILDNGRSDWLDETTWEFDWSDCADATEYHLYVIGGFSQTGETVQTPVIDVQKLNSSIYQYTTNSYFTGTGFTWKVRAKVNGEWGDWSAKRTFEVEDYDTDLPSSVSANSATQQELKGYLLFWEGEQVGHEPNWTCRQALENLLWNIKQYPNKKVEGWFSGKIMAVAGTGYELFWNCEKVGYEPQWSKEQATQNLLWNLNQYPDKDLEGLFNGELLIP